MYACKKKKKKSWELWTLFQWQMTNNVSLIMYIDFVTMYTHYKCYSPDRQRNRSSECLSILLQELKRYYQRRSPKRTQSAFYIYPLSARVDRSKKGDKIVAMWNELRQWKGDFFTYPWVHQRFLRVWLRIGDE